MNTANCKHEMKELVLHYYGELSESESDDIDVRLKVCPNCQEYYAGLLSMESVVPRTPSVEPDETVMSAIRSVTSRRIRERNTQLTQSTSRSGFHWPMPVWARGSLVVAALAVTFIAGRISISPDSPSAPPVDAPVIADISNLVFNSETGRVDVEYRTVGASTVSGSFEDSNIRSLIGHALTSADNPATRLRAMKMLNSIESSFIRPDAELVSALSLVVRDDPNNGMKLQALQALRRVHQDMALDAALRDLLMSVLDSAPNSALRIEALELLTESEMARQDLTRVLARAAMDENSFVRFRAKTELDRLEDAGALDQLN